MGRRLVASTTPRSLRPILAKDLLGHAVHVAAVKVVVASCSCSCSCPECAWRCVLAVAGRAFEALDAPTGPISIGLNHLNQFPSPPQQARPAA